MFEDFFNNASSLGLDILKEKYLPSDDKEATKTQTQQKVYEQVQQRTVPAPVAVSTSLLDNKAVLYGGGAFMVLVVVLLVKGK